MTSPDALYFQMPFGNPIQDTFGRDILDTAGREILDLDWSDIQADVLTETPITIFQGQRYGDPLDRVADGGTIKFVLNNSEANSAGLLGYYSPDHVNKRAHYGLGTLVRVGIEKDAVIEWLAQGKIISIDPEPGLLGNKRVDVTAGDWLELASRTPMPRIPVQESVADDQVIQVIVDALGMDAPTEIDLEPGAYVYPYALTDVEDEVTPVMTVLQRLAQCGLGRIFITGGTTGGEVLRYVDLTSLLSVGEPVASFVNSFMNAEASRRAYKRIKRVTATSYPMQLSTDVVLYAIPAEISISAGDTIELTGFFRDPNASSSLSIPAINVGTPAADTGFKFSSTSGGSGTDMNGNLQILSFEVGAKSFKARLRNSGGVTGYLWQFSVAGDALLPYDSLPVTEIAESIREQDAVSLNYDLPYHDNYHTTKEIATALLGWYSEESTSMPYIEFVPTLSDADFQKMLDVKPGELISVAEDVTGVSYLMIVLGREISIWNGGAYINERLYITPAQQVESGLFFTLDLDGQDDLDGPHTILSIGS
jgi:hypothetical protein